jgi:hypothetical protein
VLEDTNAQVKNCLERAAVARVRAERTSDPYLKQDLLDIETRWLRLAESYELVARLDLFIASAKRGLKDRKKNEP